MTQNARQLPSRSTDGTVLELGTSFDANGNVAGVTDYTAAARQTKSMGYDGLDRLTSTTSPMFGTANYAYDTLDNLKQVTVSGGSTPRNHYYCYHATSRRLDFVRSGPVCTGTASPAVTTVGYDVQGNLGNKNGTTYTFDYGNRLRSTAGLTYRYDAQGRRVRQDTAGAQLKYSFYSGDGKLRCQRDEPAAKRLSHIYLAGSLIAELSRPIGAGTAAYTYQHTDALGSPIARTNSAGTVIETSEYEPYGKLLNRANDDRPGYTGHVMDSASGLTYMQQRYYDPQIGGFLSVDPVTAYDNGDMRFFNRYAYAFNNPYRFTDPDGRCAVGCTIALGAGIGGFISGGLEVYRQYNAGKGFDGSRILAETGKGAVIGAVAGSFGLLGAAAATSAGAGTVGTLATSATAGGLGATVMTLSASPATDVIKGDKLKSSSEYGKEALIAGAGTTLGSGAGSVVERGLAQAGARATGTGAGSQALRVTGRLATPASKAAEEVVNNRASSALSSDEKKKRAE